MSDRYFQSSKITLHIIVLNFILIFEEEKVITYNIVPRPLDIFVD